MKKLYISCPMRGRTPEAIKASIEKMHKIAEATVGEELEIINSYIEDAGYKDRPIACLGESIKRMQNADYVAVVDDLQYRYPGISVEMKVAHNYHIQVIPMYSGWVCPDVCDNKLAESVTCE